MRLSPLLASLGGSVDLSPEGLGALKAVLNNRVQRAMNLFFGSVLATISLTVPVVTLIAFMTGNELQLCTWCARNGGDGGLFSTVPYLLLHRTN